MFGVAILISVKIINILKAENNIIIEEIAVIRDDRDEIIARVRQLSQKYDYVFTTGGIGPTHDDITSEAVASALNIDFAVNRDILRRLQEYYSTQGQELNDARRKMAYVPIGSELLYCDQ